MKTTHLDNEINRLKWLKRKGDLSPIGENTLIEYEAIKKALSIAKVVDRSEQLPDFLYEDDGEIKIGVHGDTVVTDEWNKWKENNLR